MGLIQQLDSDLKQAILSGNRIKADTLKSIKSSLQYAQVSGKSKTELDEGQIVSVLKKESKKRQEASAAYEQADSTDRSKQELEEKAIIDAYLPEPLDESAIEKLVEDTIEKNGIEATPKNMGLIIKMVRDQAGPSTDGGAIAAAVKKRVST